VVKYNGLAFSGHNQCSAGKVEINGTDLMRVCVSTVDQLFIAVIQHPQLGLISALIEKRAQQTEVGDDLAGLMLGEVVRQLKSTHLSVVGQSITSAAKNS